MSETPLLLPKTRRTCPTVQDRGITELCHPSQQDDVAADVIFVHGLQGHPKTTWEYRKPRDTTNTIVQGREKMLHEKKNKGWCQFLTKWKGKKGDDSGRKTKSGGTDIRKKVKNEEGSDDGYGKTAEQGNSNKRSTLAAPNNDNVDIEASEHCYWPFDLLPNDIQSIRIMTYGYDSHISHFYRDSTNQTNITQHGRLLLEKVTNCRSKCRGRPVIFVAHSLGGILVKDAIIESLKHKHQKDMQDIGKSTYAVIFFGTPHLGAKAADWGVVLSNILSFFPLTFSTYDQVLRGLKPDSEKLDSVSRDFNDILNDDKPVAEKIKIYSFQEGSGVFALSAFDGKVVPDTSSFFNRRDIERASVIHENHMNMCKFKFKEDPGYRDFMNAIESYLHDIKERQGAPPGIEGSNREVRSLEGSGFTGKLKSSKPHVLLQFDRNVDFVGRMDTLTEIDQSFELKHCVALWGIGGVGKSQIAIEYCYRFQDQHPEGYVFWVHSSNAIRFDQSYKHIARKLGLPGIDDENIDTLRAVSDWLSDDSNGPWLMVLDNADNEEVLFGPRAHVSSQIEPHQFPPLSMYFPHSSNGWIIITTRDERVGKGLKDAERIFVPKLREEDAKQLLQKVPNSNVWSSVEVRELLSTLEFLPLAITQAAAFISENDLSLVKYLELLRASDSDMKDLLSQEYRDSGRDWEIRNSVFHTWRISFDQIRQKKPRATEILSLMATLDRQEIPEALLFNYLEPKVDFITEIQTLKAFSLITKEQKGNIFRMHRLVQLSTQRWLELQGKLVEMQERALNVVSTRCPSSPEYKTWSDWEVISPHIRVVLGYSFESERCLLQRADILTIAARYDEKRGKYEHSRKKAVEALKIRKRYLGNENPNTLTTMNALANALHGQEKYRESEEIHQQVLGFRERVLGKDHPDTLASMNNLADILTHLNKHEEAEEMHRRALGLIERVHGEDHPDTLTGMNNLAVGLQRQGKHKEAEEMHRRVLGLRERVLGEDHPDTLTSMDNLAVGLQRQGKHKEAEEMHRRVLGLRERVLGEDHPDTLTSMDNLAVGLQRQGKHKEAEEMDRRVLGLRERVLGEDHPDTGEHEQSGQHTPQERRVLSR